VYTDPFGCDGDALVCCRMNYGTRTWEGTLLASPFILEKGAHRELWSSSSLGLKGMSMVMLIRRPLGGGWREPVR